MHGATYGLLSAFFLDLCYGRYASKNLMNRILIPEKHRLVTSVRYKIFIAFKLFSNIFELDVVNEEFQLEECPTAGRPEA